MSKEKEQIGQLLNEIHEPVQNIIESKITPTLIEVANYFTKNKLYEISEFALGIAYDELACSEWYKEQNKATININDLDYKSFSEFKKLVDLYNIPKELKEKLNEVEEIFKLSEKSKYLDNVVQYLNNSEYDKNTFNNSIKELKESKKLFEEYIKNNKINKNHNQTKYDELKEQIYKLQKINRENYSLFKGSDLKFSIQSILNRIINESTTQKITARAENKQIDPFYKNASEKALKLLQDLKDNKLNIEEVKDFFNNVPISEYDNLGLLESNSQIVRKKIEESIINANTLDSKDKQKKEKAPFSDCYNPGFVPLSGEKGQECRVKKDIKKIN